LSRTGDAGVATTLVRPRLESAYAHCEAFLMTEEILSYKHPLRARLDARRGREDTVLFPGGALRLARGDTREGGGPGSLTIVTARHWRRTPPARRKKENRRGRREGGGTGRRGGPFRWDRFALKFGFGTRARIGGRAEAPRVNPRGSVFSPEFIDLVERTNVDEIQQRIWKNDPPSRAVTRHTESAIMNGEIFNENINAGTYRRYDIIARYNCLKKQT